MPKSQIKALMIEEHCVKKIHKLNDMYDSLEYLDEEIFAFVKYNYRIKIARLQNIIQMCCKSRRCGNGIIEISEKEFNLIF